MTSWIPNETKAQLASYFAGAVYIVGYGNLIIPQVSVWIFFFVVLGIYFLFLSYERKYDQ